MSKCISINIVNIIETLINIMTRSKYQSKFENTWKALFNLRNSWNCTRDLNFVMQLESKGLEV